MIIPIKIRECDWSDFVIEGDRAENGTIKLGQLNAPLKAKPMTLFDDKNPYADQRLNTPEERDAVWTKLVQQFRKNLALWYFCLCWSFLQQIERYFVGENSNEGEKALFYSKT